MKRPVKGMLVASALVAVVYGLLAAAEAGMVFYGSGPDRCDLEFPKWFGCVLANHEGLAGGLIGAAGALFAGWLAWSAVQAQIDAENQRAIADRKEVEALLADDIDIRAEGLAAIWEVLEKEQEAQREIATEISQEAIRYGINVIADAAWLATTKGMLPVLNWKRRREFLELLQNCSRLNEIAEENSLDVRDALAAVTALATSMQICCPPTCEYFDRFFMRAGSAMSVGDVVRMMANIEEPQNGKD